MSGMARNLGIVPAWQFSPDPRVNPLLNPHASIPPGWISQSNPAQVAGIPTAGMVVTRAAVQPSSGVALSGAQFGLVPFDSWWWTNRKKLVIGGLAVLGLAGAAILTAVLK
jgi:hypothetical protein